ncbi:deoxyribose-phosphate aldolase [Acetivibrio straminisolvens]|uniref:Deoxyribose-phosphate aldolase n=1 Tax=Acetivibrio straminisolvens JCM 21531 TaxID=1294263 RepID=W4V7A5_9FIRM|nr:deoxyribose-phosphate aldolase [Acetivibrio straminisolvens]GAE88693.1 deoxyribose-phosphate aldolase [Acetivibrio straminisolvens JCM 21531]
MDKNTVISMIDHAVLKPDATDADVLRECEIAVKYGVASVCVKPCHVALAREALKGSKVKVSTVIGFPHGSATTACKVFEAVEAMENGAEELDMVINIGKLLAEDYYYVRDDIKGVVSVAHEKGVIVKVIIETALLDLIQKVQACKLAEEAGADFVKTSTGFNGRGAALEDICIMRGAVGPNMKIKASGGIKTFEQAVEFINAGCERLGTSSTVAIFEEAG